MYTELRDDFSFTLPYLGPGEMILWRGKPEKGHLFGPQDLFLIPFSIVWCGFAIFWEATAILGGAPFFFALFGLPFICVGLYITVGRFFHIAWLRKNTAYVITTAKLIRRRGKRIDMLDAKTMPAIHVTARTDGTGTIRFGQPTYYMNRRGLNHYDSHLFTLDNIADVARVQQILHSLAGN